MMHHVSSAGRAILALGIAVLFLFAAGAVFTDRRSGAEDAAAEIEPLPPPSLTEARARARLLHETLNGALQVMHRDFFNEDDASTIPSASLEDVFDELAANHNVSLKWLTVETDVLNVDHKPADEFEQQAAKALKAGKGDFEAVAEATYQFAGPIRLSSQCLKCHVKTRTNVEPRTAGLVIRMPLAPSP